MDYAGLNLKKMCESCMHKAFMFKYVDRFQPYTSATHKQRYCCPWNRFQATPAWEEEAVYFKDTTNTINSIEMEIHRLG